AIEHQRPFVQGAVEGNLDIGLGAFYGAEIAARVFDGNGKRGPFRIVVGDFDSLDAGQIDDGESVVLGADAARLDIVVDVLGETCEQELEARTVRLRLHIYRLPLRGSGIAREQAGRGGFETDERGGDELVRAAPHLAVAGIDANVVESLGGGDA